MSVQATESKQKKGLLSGLLSGAKAIWALAIVLALFATFGALTILGNAAATQTYYVLNQNVPARTMVTTAMLEERQAKVGQTPPTALDLVDVQTGEVFTKIALAAGDVVTTSNAGPLTRITEDVPDNFVAASFSAQPELAVAGKVRKGDYIDLIATSDDGASGTKSKVVLAHVLVLDVTVSPSTIAGAAVEGQEGADAGQPGPESAAARSGIPSVYTVALSPQDATKLAVIRNYDIFVVLSGNVPDLNPNVESQIGSVFSGPVGDSSAGTFGSVYLKRWDLAFEEDNVYVDDSGKVWKVDGEGLWSTTGQTLDAGDTPPGYLPLPEGMEFTDADDVYWVAIALTEAQSGGLFGATEGAVWSAPEKGTELEPGDNPDGFDPHAEFDQGQPEAAN